MARMRRGHPGAVAEHQTTIIEMRTYKTKPGMRAIVFDLIRSKITQAHKAIGMTTLGPFPSIEDPDTYFWMRGFPDANSRETMKTRFYEGTLWKGELESVVLPMLNSYEVVVVEDTDGLISW
jgi:hypothetical protein